MEKKKKKKQKKTEIKLKTEDSITLYKENNIINRCLGRLLFHL